MKNQIYLFKWINHLYEIGLGHVILNISPWNGLMAIYYKGCKGDTMSQHDYCKKRMYVFFPKKHFFIWMNFGTMFFATCYNKCL
jgi:hypothetical protein